MRVGVHTSIAGGVEKAAHRAKEIGCDTFQMFSANPRGWKTLDAPPADCERFRESVAVGRLVSGAAKDWRRVACIGSGRGFAGGYCITTPRGLGAMRKQLDSTAGLESGRVLHDNASKTAFASRAHRHQHIGKGRI